MLWRSEGPKSPERRCILPMDCGVRWVQGRALLCLFGAKSAAFRRKPLFGIASATGPMVTGTRLS